ncbi:hypothetical protein CR513_07478, partial [Mucuna pruriens]
MEDKIIYIYGDNESVIVTSSLDKFVATLIGRSPYWQNFVGIGFVQQLHDLPLVVKLIGDRINGSFEAYEQRMNRHNEDFVENSFQSKLNLQFQNKEHEKNSRNKENSKSFFKNNQEKYPRYSIFKKTSHLQKDVGIAKNHNVIIARNLDMWRRTVSSSKSKHRANFVEEHDNE